MRATTAGRKGREQPEGDSPSSLQARRRVVLLVTLFTGIAGGAPAQSDGHEESLGRVDFPVSCSEPARAIFERGVALLHHMTYPQSRETFARAATIDPRCAMAHWGRAMTLFTPLWPTRPDAAALAGGWQEVVQAKALEPPTERERLFVAAAEAFFLEPASSDYWLRIRRWEQAQEQLYRTYPDDPEAAAFYALALLATAPADTVSRGHADQAAEILLEVYRRNPDHPGAMHYLVHANDTPGREHESLEITRRYESVAPRNPHALHMPTHIYTRLGDWDAVVRGNLLAATAALEVPVGEHGDLVWDEFPHALEYLVYAFLQKGADEEAAAAVRRLRETRRLQPSFKTAFHLASTQARTVLEQRDWEAAGRIVPGETGDLDWEKFTWPQAISWFARGMGAVHLEDTAAAAASQARLEALERATDAAGEALFARNIEVLRLDLEAWIDQAKGRPAAAVAALEQAAELEASTPKHAVTPAPTLPAAELLGDLLLVQDRAADAVAAYRRSLEAYPRRFNSLLGIARARRALGRDDEARSAYEELLEVAAGGTRREPLDEARSFLAARP